MNTILQKRIEEAAKKAKIDFLNRFDWSGNQETGFKKGAVWMLCNQWIPVEEALPEEKFDDGYQFVFVRIHLYDDTFYYDTDYIRKGKWELHKNQEITHWMLIPSLEGGEK